LSRKKILKKSPIASRFRGFLPIVIDVETSGLNPATDGLLEIAMVILDMDEKGAFHPIKTTAYHIEPFSGARLDPDSLALTGIDPTHPLRYAISEQQALHRIFLEAEHFAAKAGCKRAVLVGHNAWFDLAFIQAAIKRHYFPVMPFHSFTSFDTATLSAVMLGETVLAKAMRAARIRFDINQAHSAIYDAEKTAELFCYLVNRFHIKKAVI
jgi:ribonuclease T